MLSLLLAASLAASPTPRALPGAEPTLFVPRLDQLGGVLAFLEHAGDSSVALRPSTWRDDLIPLLQVDPTRPESLATAGIDPAGPATISILGDDQVTCLGLKDAKAFEARAQKALAARGEPWKGKAQGVALVGIKSGKDVVAGYALRGGEACVAQGPDSETHLQDAARQLVKPSLAPTFKGLAGLPGAAFVVTSRGVVGLSGDVNALQAEARTTRLPLPPLRSGGEGPYVGVAPSGLVFARTQLEPSAYPRAMGALEYQVSRGCPACDRSKMAEITSALTKYLTGHVLARVDRVQPGGTMRTVTGRYFALKHAYLAEVSKPEEARALLAPLASWPNARKADDGFVITTPEGEISVGVRGAQLYLGNDAEALKAAFDTVAGDKRARLAHGAEVFVEPKKVARGLAKISLLDALGSRELAGLLAVATELGPLFAASESLTGWIDSAGAGGHRVSASWKLPPAPP
ncbi:MAG TPA: hypothetical protein VK420_08195, partial [Longimicrobium sp.]|nr:hypothetical protein [Longimicrobium sp.]